MKVIQVLYHSLTPYAISRDIIGFGEDVHVQWAKALCNYSPKVKTIECWRPECSVRRKIIYERDGVVYRIFPSFRFGRRDLPFSMWFELKKLSREEDFIIHLHGLFNPTTYMVLTLLKTMPIVIQAHGRHVFKPSFKDEIKKVLFSNTGHLLALTKEDMDFLKRLYNLDDNIDVMPGVPVDFELFKPINMVYSKNELSLDKDKRYILFVGRLDKMKGLENLLEAFSIVNNHRDNIFLLLAGEGAFKKNILELSRRFKVSESIRCVGWIDKKHLPLYYNASEVLVLPSVNEGLPSVLIEAMASGMPVIATPIAGIKQILNDFDGGMIVPMRDPLALAEAIDRVLDNPSAYMPKNVSGARQRYHSPYLIKRITDIYDALWLKHFS